jgi:enhancer of mRNA-decapping protein 4
MTIEGASKDALTRICGSKAFTDAISQSLLTGTQKSLEVTFKKSLEDVLIPAYERITNEMFQEMGKAFTAGTKECKIF